MVVKRETNAAGQLVVTGIERGMVFWATVPPAQAEGSEQSHGYPNPWLVVSSNKLRLPIVIAVPLSTKLHKGDAPQFRGYRIRVPASQILPLKSNQKPLTQADQLVLTEQVRVMSHERLQGDPVAKLTRQALFAVEAGLRHVLDMP